MTPNIDMEHKRDTNKLYCNIALTSKGKKKPNFGNGWKTGLKKKNANAAYILTGYDFYVVDIDCKPPYPKKYKKFIFKELNMFSTL